MPVDNGGRRSPVHSTVVAMITSLPSSQGPTAATGVAAAAACATGAAASYQVRTSALDDVCAGLERAVDQCRRLLEHPGVIRGRAADSGDDELRNAASLLADRWEWGLQVLVDEATTLFHDLRSAADLYDEVERTSVLVPVGTRRVAP